MDVMLVCRSSFVIEEIACNTIKCLQGSGASLDAKTVFRGR